MIHSTTLSVLNSYSTVKPASQSKQKDEGQAVTRRKEKKDEDRSKNQARKNLLTDDDADSTIVIYA